MGQVWVGGAVRDFIKDCNKKLNPPACTVTVIATRTKALRVAEIMVERTPIDNRSIHQRLHVGFCFWNASTASTTEVKLLAGLVSFNSGWLKVELLPVLLHDIFQMVVEGILAKRVLDPVTTRGFEVFHDLRNDQAYSFRL